MVIKRESMESKMLRLGETLRSAEGTIRLAEAALRIRDKKGFLQPLRANAAQERFERYKGRRNIVLKARQMGMTTWIAGRFFLQTALQAGSTTLLVAHNQHAAEVLFGMVRRMWEELPQDVQQGQFALRRLNAAEMIFACGSEYRVASAADVNAGRGLSLQHLHCSEVSRWAGDAGATLAGLRAALVPDGELVLESTPTGAYGAFYEEWKAAAWPEVEGEASLSTAAVPGGAEHDGERHDGAEREHTKHDGGEDGLVRHFFPWWLEPSYAGRAVGQDAMTEDELRMVMRYGLTEAQIGFRRELERSYGALRKQEFAEDAETCFRATGSCCFEIEVLERRLRDAPEPYRRSRNGALWEWLPAQTGRQYVVAVDTAGGGAEGDFAAIQVLDLSTGMQCAELQERLRPAVLADVCMSLATTYNGALIAVERNNHGAAVLALLEREPQARLYRHANEAGWLTTAASKPETVGRLGSLLRQQADLFLSRRLLEECRTFVLDERGRAGAAGGAHDDLVMAMAVGQSVRAEILRPQAPHGRRDAMRV